MSLNVHASTLEQDRLLPVWLAEQAREYGFPCNRLIIEIVEHAPPWSGPSFLLSLDRLRGLGVRIALDDVGLGQSNFRMILDCQPDLLKIDRHFVSGAHADPHRGRCRSIADLACRLGGRAVAEEWKTSGTSRWLSGPASISSRAICSASPLQSVP